MASSKLEIIIDAKDNASGVLGRIGGGLNSLAGIAAGAAVAGFAALGAGIASSISEAMEAQDVLTELNAVIASTEGVAGVTSEAAQKLASDFQKITRFSDDAIMSGESMLLTFTNIGKDVFPEATEAMLNLAQKFGSMDQASMMLGKALNDPVAGVTALRRMAIQFSPAQEEMINKMVAMGDVAGAQRVILGELTTQFGDLAVLAGGTAAGKIDIFKNKIGEVQERIGGAFLPAISLAADKLSTWVDSPGFKAGVDTVTGGIQQMIDVITPLSEGNTLLALQNFQHLLMNLGFSSEQISSITEAGTAIGETSGRISESFGKIFSTDAKGGGAIVTTLEGIASAMEKIAAAGDVAAQIRAIFDAMGAGGGTNAIAQEATGINFAQPGVMRPVPGQFGGTGMGAVRNVGGLTNESIGSGLSQASGQLGAGDIGASLATLADMIAKAISAAPPPVVNVSANLDGAQIANSVSVRLGDNAQGLNRIGGHAGMR